MVVELARTERASDRADRSNDANIRSILLYEYAVSGGAWGVLRDADLVAALRPEGAAMHDAVAEDLTRAGFVTRSVRDEGSDARNRTAFLEGCRTSDAVWLIAPEIHGILLALTELVESAGKRLLSPGSACVRIAQDKQATAEHLAARGIRVPSGVAVARGETPAIPWSGPSIVKPRDGAGSAGVAPWHGWTLPRDSVTRGGWRIEERCEGLAASVAVLCGRRRYVALPPCTQRLAGPDGLTYVGGSLPLTDRHAARARALALDAARAFPEIRGYIGVDLILSTDERGTLDTVIEVNPRLTTSYIGLRRACRDNLASACVAAANGLDVDLRWRQCRIEFDADGTVRDADG